jgi:DNA-binding transcriptional MocR family regulator
LVFDVGAGSELWGRLGHDRIETAWLRAPPSLYSPVLSVKWLTDRHSEISEQHLIAAFIAEEHFARYIRRMQRIYFE